MLQYLKDKVTNKKFFPNYVQNLFITIFIFFLNKRMFESVSTESYRFINIGNMIKINYNLIYTILYLLSLLIFTLPLNFLIK